MSVPLVYETLYRFVIFQVKSLHNIHIIYNDGFYALVLNKFCHSFLCFLFELCSGIQKQISASSAGRKFLALTLIKVSMAYMEMKRIYEVHDTFLTLVLTL